MAEFFPWCGPGRSKLGLQGGSGYPGFIAIQERRGYPPARQGGKALLGAVFRVRMAKMRQPLRSAGYLNFPSALDARLGSIVSPQKKAPAWPGLVEKTTGSIDQYVKGVISPALSPSLINADVRLPLRCWQSRAASSVAQKKQKPTTQPWDSRIVGADELTSATSYAPAMTIELHSDAAKGYVRGNMNRMDECGRFGSRDNSAV